MKPIHGFFVSTEQRYNNTVDVDGKDLIVNTEITERDYEFVNREAVVVGTPRGYSGDIQEGFKVLVHHNIFRRWYDVRGHERNSGSYIDEDLYIAYPDQIFAYKDDKWKACDGYTFVYPLENTDQWDVSVERPLHGVDLDGNYVGFTPDSEYEFTIEGKKVYRVLSNQITWTSKRKESRS